jgi:hypothetical protein
MPRPPKLASSGLRTSRRPNETAAPTTPGIFDNIDERLPPELQKSLAGGGRADFRVGRFNLRGRAQLAPPIEEWNPDGGRQRRLLVGMRRRPHDELRAALNPLRDDSGVSRQAAVRRATRLAEDFRLPPMRTPCVSFPDGFAPKSRS